MLTDIERTAKLDLKKQHKEIYAPSAKKASMLDLSPMTYLVAGGKGTPESAEYARAVQILFAVSYTTKFTTKKGPRALDYRP